MMNKEQMNDLKTAVNNAGGPAAVGNALGSLAANLLEQRNDLIATLATGGHCMFTRAELRNLSTATLQRLVQQAGISVNSADSYVKVMPSPW